MDINDRRRAAELLKDMIVERKRSRWPAIICSVFMLALIGAGVYWFYLPVNERPDLRTLQARLLAAVNSFLNAPVGPSNSAPTSKQLEKKTSPASAGDTGLLSN